MDCIKRISLDNLAVGERILVLGFALAPYPLSLFWATWETMTLWPKASGRLVRRLLWRKSGSCTGGCALGEGPDGDGVGGER